MATKQTTQVTLANPDTSLGPVHWVALSLAAVTGVIHLYLYVTDSWFPFLLAGAGFVSVIGLFFLLKEYRRPIYLVGVLFTVAQILGYLLFPMGPLWLGVFDKAVQVALIVALGYLSSRPTTRQRRPEPKRSRGSEGDDDVPT